MYNLLYSTYEGEGVVVGEEEGYGEKDTESEI